MSSKVDLVVVGAGVLGLAHAYHAAKLGLKVAVFERNPRAIGASVRNFGMIWPVGQPSGMMRDMALRSRDHWLEVAPAAGLWHQPCGSLHLAYADDELQILEEFLSGADGLRLEMLSSAQIQDRYGAVNQNGLKGGLFSHEEVCVDPRQAIGELPAYLERELGVEFHFNTVVTGWEEGEVRTSRGRVSANHLIVCSGDDFQTLFPEAFDESGIIRCKLQMMRSQPFGSEMQIGTMLAAGLTLTHYGSFAQCATLPALKARLEREMPEYGRLGIHVMASQHGSGELTIGDSHEYLDLDTPVLPFDRDEIDALILDYLKSFLNVPQLKITQRWQGVYAKHPQQPFFVVHPVPGATIVMGAGGAGMTLSFGLAERIMGEMK